MKIIRILFVLIMCWMPLLWGHSSFKGAYFTGHLSPDTDSITAAIGAAKLYDGTAVRPGPLNPETQFVLKYFHYTDDIPSIDNAPSDATFVVLDFNQRSQAHPRLTSESIVGIVDHHALNDKPLTFTRPIVIDIQPRGSAAAMIAQSFFDQNKPLDKQTAGILLAGLISDTLILTSPTTTPEDRQLAEQLAVIAEVDIQTLGEAMLNAKSDLSQLSDEAVVELDYKIFESNNERIGFGVAETKTPQDLLKRKAGLLKAMKALKEKSDANYVYFAIVDIDHQKSYLLIVGENEEALAKSAYKEEVVESVMTLPGMVSRKNQFIPSLLDAHK